MPRKRDKTFWLFTLFTTSIFAAFWIIFLVRVVTDGYLDTKVWAWIWLSGSMVGVLAAIIHLYKTLGDWRALRTRSDADDALRLRIVDELLQECMRMAVHFLFLLLGSLVIFIPPPELTRLGDGFIFRLLGWAFFVLPVWVALKSIFALWARVWLERILYQGSTFSFNFLRFLPRLLGQSR